ncbi:DUF4232 domain-containing protein [Streptomyces sp. NPDC058864]
MNVAEHEAMPTERCGGCALPNRRSRRTTGRLTRAGGPVPLLVGGLVLAAVLTGCGDSGGKETASAPRTLPGSAGPVSGDLASGDPASSAKPSGETPASAPAASTTPSSSGSSSGHTGEPPQAGGRCHTSDLSASIGRNDPGAGQENFPIVLTNRSGRTCTVRGFPGVAFVNAAGEQVTVDPERATGQSPRRVSLAPGASAWSAMSFSNPAITGVTTVTPAAVMVTPPDETASLKVPWTGGEVSNTGKASVPRLGPFQPGAGPA